MAELVYRPVIALARVVFAAQGLRIVAHAGDPCDTPVEQGNIAPSRWVELAHSVKDVEADGLLISCAGVQLSGVLAEIEADFGRPVNDAAPCVDAKQPSVRQVRHPQALTVKRDA